MAGTFESGEAVVGGVLCGTSGDGIDVALASMRVEGLKVLECVPLAYAERPFPPQLQPQVRAALDGAALGAREIALLSRDLGLAFGQAARDVARQSGLGLDLLGSHGLTIYHHDGLEPSGVASLQIGEGDHVAQAAGCSVVSDFRQADLAAGGEGAPISVLADDAIFWRVPRPTTILNLGGMANLSWLGTQTSPLAFDTGPAGALLDGLSRRLLGEEFDPGGANANKGLVRDDWLASWLEHPFFELLPPKSTGRDTFGESWIGALLARTGAAASAPDLLRTAVELVAKTVVDALQNHLPPLRGDLLVAGGGLHNRCLMSALGERLGGRVGSSEVAGVDPNGREGLVFAVLAARAVLGEPVMAQTATGAAGAKILGKISQYSW